MVALGLVALASHRCSPAVAPRPHWPGLLRPGQRGVVLARCAAAGERGHRLRADPVAVALLRAQSRSWSACCCPCPSRGGAPRPAPPGPRTPRGRPRIRGRAAGPGRRGRRLVLGRVAGGRPDLVPHRSRRPGHGERPPAVEARRRRPAGRAAPRAAGPEDDVLLPPTRMKVLSMYTTDFFPLVPRDWFIRQIHEPKKDRKRPQAPRPTSPRPRRRSRRRRRWPTALARLDVTLACTGGSPRRAKVLDALRGRGLHEGRAGRDDGLHHPSGSLSGSARPAVLVVS